jgi:hypothetical protein
LPASGGALLDAVAEATHVVQQEVRERFEGDPIERGDGVVPGGQRLYVTGRQPLTRRHGP